MISLDWERSSKNLLWGQKNDVGIRCLSDIMVFSSGGIPLFQENRTKIVVVGLLDNEQMVIYR